MNRSQMLRLMFKIRRLLIKFNQIIYILPFITMFISMLKSLINYPIFQRLNQVLKIVIFLNIVFCFGLCIYFIDLVSPLTLTYSIYSDFLEFYIELIKNIWDQIINYIKNISAGPVNNIEGIPSQVKDLVKGGIKEGIKEGIEELIEELKEVEAHQSNTLKQFCLISSVLFFIYFIFYLPGSSISPEDLVQYNWLNHSLIELKINIINLLSNSSNPGTPPSSPTINSIIDLNVNIPKTMVDVATSPIVELTKSPISPGLSEGLSTITPNTPIANIKSLSEYVEGSSQTILEGMEVGKLVAATGILGDSLPQTTQINLNNAVNTIITKITD